MGVSARTLNWLAGKPGGGAGMVDVDRRTLAGLVDRAASRIAARLGQGPAHPYELDDMVKDLIKAGKDRKEAVREYDRTGTDTARRRAEAAGAREYELQRRFVETLRGYTRAVGKDLIPGLIEQYRSRFAEVGEDLPAWMEAAMLSAPPMRPEPYTGPYQYTVDKRLAEAHKAYQEKVRSGSVDEIGRAFEAFKEAIRAHIEIQPLREELERLGDEYARTGDRASKARIDKLWPGWYEWNSKWAEYYRTGGTPQWVLDVNQAIMTAANLGLQVAPLLPAARGAAVTARAYAPAVRHGLPPMPRVVPAPPPPVRAAIPRPPALAPSLPPAPTVLFVPWPKDLALPPLPAILESYVFEQPGTGQVLFDKRLVDFVRAGGQLALTPLPGFIPRPAAPAPTAAMPKAMAPPISAPIEFLTPWARLKTRGQIEAVARAQEAAASAAARHRSDPERMAFTAMRSMVDVRDLTPEERFRAAVEAAYSVADEATRARIRAEMAARVAGRPVDLSFPLSSLWMRAKTPLYPVSAGAPAELPDWMRAYPLPVQRSFIDWFNRGKIPAASLFDPQREAVWRQMLDAFQKAQAARIIPEPQGRLPAPAAPTAAAPIRRYTPFGPIPAASAPAGAPPLAVVAAPQPTVAVARPKPAPTDFRLPSLPFGLPFGMAAA